MSVKLRIWLLPLLAAVIFAIGIGTVLIFSARTSSAIESLGAVDYPYLESTTQFGSQLKALSATIQSAVAEGEKKRLDEAAERANAMRQTLATMKGLAGKGPLAATLSQQFEAYYAATTDAAAILLGSKTGDQAAAISAMQSTQKTLETTMKKTTDGGPYCRLTTAAYQGRGDPRSPAMQSTMNLKIKYRESFRPFAPSVLREDVSEWFDLDGDSPYMLLCADVAKRLRREMTDAEKALWGIEKLNVPRSTIPAVTHVDYSARLQTVRKETNPVYHAILSAFRDRTGCPVVVNTSFNVRGEPIVCSPEDAYRCFMRTAMDALVLENHVLVREDQPAFAESGDWKKTFALD